MTRSKANFETKNSNAPPSNPRFFYLSLSLSLFFFNCCLSWFPCLLNIDAHLHSNVFVCVILRIRFWVNMLPRTFCCQFQIVCYDHYQDSTLFDKSAMNTLIRTIHSNEHQFQAAWLNALLGRIFLG